MHQKQPPANVAFSSGPSSGLDAGVGVADAAARINATTRIVCFMTVLVGDGSGPEWRQRFAVGDELERQAVVAPALSGRRWAVVEDVALVAAASHAVVFGARDHEPVVALGCHAPGDWFVETRPAGAAFELRG